MGWQFFDESVFCHPRPANDNIPVCSVIFDYVDYLSKPMFKGFLAASAKPGLAPTTGTVFPHYVRSLVPEDVYSFPVGCADCRLIRIHYNQEIRLEFLNFGDMVVSSTVVYPPNAFVFLLDYFFAVCEECDFFSIISYGVQQFTQAGFDGFPGFSVFDVPGCR